VFCAGEARTKHPAFPTLLRCYIIFYKLQNIGYSIFFKNWILNPLCILITEAAFFFSFPYKIKVF